MYAGRIVCCPLVSHVEYAPLALFRLEKYGTGGRTPDRYVRLPLQLTWFDAVGGSLAAAAAWATRVEGEVTAYTVPS